ncbi:MAG: hypothetical protein H6597_03155 [Flavobacteriales bacterium]|nr:hypothetical protein [Flavobacteriales bacterium]MCB9193504.1 hypothetical protein [Flavobacteriales bacterium]
MNSKACLLSLGILIRLDASAQIDTPMQVDPERSARVVDRQQLNDSVTYTIFESGDGVCLRQWVEVFLEGHRTDSLEIYRGCDHDNAIPVYFYRTYTDLSSGVFELCDYREWADSTLLDSEGNFREGSDFLNAKTYADSLCREVRVLESGMIVDPIK